MRYPSIIAAFAVAFITTPSVADISIYNSKPDWQSAAGSYTFIGFTGFATNTFITNQYADQGVVFTDGNDHIRNSPGYLDGSALISTEFISPYGGRIHLAFDGARSSMALEYRGSILVELYMHGRLLDTTVMYSAAFTPFVGLTSTASFDSAIVYDGDDEVVVVDNLYFGPTVPAPGSIVLLWVAAFTARHRRKEPA